MPETTHKTIVATLKGISDDEKAGKDVFTLKVLRDWMKFEEYITVWPDTNGALERPNLTKGNRYSFTVATKAKANGKGEYLDFVSAKMAGPSTQEPAGDGERTAAAVAGSPSARTERESIEAQVRYKGAVAIAVAGIEASGEKVGSYHAAQLADWCWRWATGQARVTPLFAKGPPADADDAAHNAPPSPRDDQGGGAGAQPTPQGQAPAIASLGDLYNAAMKHGYKDAAAVIRRLREIGYLLPDGKPADIARPQDAWNALEAAGPQPGPESAGPPHEVTP